MEEIVNLVRQINLEEDGDDVQKLQKETRNQELTMDEPPELQEQRHQKELESLIRRSNDGWEFDRSHSCTKIIDKAPRTLESWSIEHLSCGTMLSKFPHHVSLRTGHCQIERAAAPIHADY
ncbi:hypothetical protein TNCV_1514151 [Trichonephila clavipes]|nr:hypothetical protein TNCV_1514151 [Trichonephila clavipes]